MYINYGGFALNGVRRFIGLVLCLLTLTQAAPFVLQQRNVAVWRIVSLSNIKSSRCGWRMWACGVIGEANSLWSANRSLEVRMALSDLQRCRAPPDVSVAQSAAPPGPITDRVNHRNETLPEGHQQNMGILDLQGAFAVLLRCLRMKAYMQSFGCEPQRTWCPFHSVDASCEVIHIFIGDCFAMCRHLPDWSFD